MNNEDLEIPEPEYRPEPDPDEHRDTSLVDAFRGMANPIPSVCEYCYGGMQDDICGAASGGFCCTRKPYHAGDHVACGGHHSVFAWPSDEPAESVAKPSLESEIRSLLSQIHGTDRVPVALTVDVCDKMLVFIEDATDDVKSLTESIGKAEDTARDSLYQGGQA